MRAGRASRPVVECHLLPLKRSNSEDKVGLFFRFSHSTSLHPASFAQRSGHFSAVLRSGFVLALYDDAVLLTFSS
jgi:hypothetical protein